MKAAIPVLFVLAFFPVFSYADSADDDWWDDDQQYTCDELCSVIQDYCAISCVPDDCLTWCEQNLSSDQIACGIDYDCDTATECLCGAADDDTVDDDADDDQNAADDGNDDNDDNDDNAVCSVASEANLVGLPFGMFLVGAGAFIYSLRAGRRPKRR